MAQAIEEIAQSALASVNDFVVVLQGEGQAGLAARFRAIAGFLQEGSVAAAIVEFERGSYSGPGGLNDVYALDQTRFDAAWSQCASTLRALKRAIEK
jgi:hypothetical protein